MSRTEFDAIGSMRIDADAYFGIHTARAVENFPLSGRSIGEFPRLLTAFALVKRAAAYANNKLGKLSDVKHRAIAAACDDIAAGKIHPSSFPVDVFQGGAGTSTNMNLNEVIANLALEKLGLPPGAYAEIHPIDDVNMSQSTNDVYPTAIRVSIILAQDELIRSVESLAEAFESKSVEFDDVLKIGRTQLQEAVPMTLGQEFRAFAVSLRGGADRIADSESLLHLVNLGGTAIGTGLNASASYSADAISELGRLAGVPLVPAKDFIEASWDTEAFVHFSSALKSLAIKTSKICNDLRLLSSGPRAGLAEIVLPARQAGSSIMPGKVNPVVPEAVNQVCFQVIGSDVTIGLASQSAQLQLNAFEPLIAYNLLSSISVLTRALDALRVHCVIGIKAEVDRCRFNVEQSPSLATALAPIVGYEVAASFAKRAVREGLSIRECAIEFGIDASVVDSAINASLMASP